MLEFLKENYGTILVAFVLCIILASAFLKIRKDKKNGSSCACGCGCSGCSLKESCHKVQKK